MRNGWLISVLSGKPFPVRLPVQEEILGRSLAEVLIIWALIIGFGVLQGALRAKVVILVFHLSTRIATPVSYVFAAGGVPLICAEIRLFTSTNTGKAEK